MDAGRSQAIESSFDGIWTARSSKNSFGSNQSLENLLHETLPALECHLARKPHGKRAAAFSRGRIEELPAASPPPSSPDPIGTQQYVQSPLGAGTALSSAIALHSNKNR